MNKAGARDRGMVAGLDDELGGALDGLLDHAGGDGAGEALAQVGMVQAMVHGQRLADRPPQPPGAAVADVGHGPGLAAQHQGRQRGQPGAAARVHGQLAQAAAARPARLYGAGIASNYQGQGLKLAKQFA